MKIYLDNCCLNRLFDDQSDPRIHLESEAIKTIFALIEEGKWTLISSDVLDFEINNAPERRKTHILQLMLKLSSRKITLSNMVREQAKTYQSLGLQAFDAMHLACADEHADVLLTTDDKFVKKAQQIPDMNVKVNKPLTWLQEVLT